MKTLMTGAIAVAALVVWLGASPRAAAQAQGFLTLQGAGSSIGVTVREVTSDDAEKAKLAQPLGVLIESVADGSPAARAGFQSGDIVLDFDGERVRSVRHFTRLVQETPPRRSVSAVVVRGTSRQTLQVVPEASGSFSALAPDAFRRRFEDRLRVVPRPSPRNFAFDLAPEFLRRGSLLGSTTLGVSVTPLTDQLAEYFGVKEGALVTSVGSGTPAADAGLKAGDVITEVGGRSVSSAADVLEELRRVEPGDGVDISVTRDKKQLMLKATVPGRQLPSGRRGLPI